MNTVQPIRDAEKIKEIERHLSALEAEKGQREYLMFMIGIYLARRISDMIGLRVRDLRDKDYLRIKEKKTQKYIDLPIPTKLQRVLRRRLKGMAGHEYIFRSRQRDKNGDIRHITRKTAYNDIKRIAQDANLTSAVGCHTLRKTFGYHYYKKSGDIAMLMILFNHSSEQITKRYIGIELDEKTIAIRNFDF